MLERVENGNFRPVESSRPCKLPLFFQHRLKVQNDKRPTINISLSRELRALGITPEAIQEVQLQRQTEETRRRPIEETEEPPEPEEPEEPEEPNEPNEPRPKMSDSIKVPKPDKFDGKDMSLGAVTAR